MSEIITQSYLKFAEKYTATPDKTTVEYEILKSDITDELTEIGVGVLTLCLTTLNCNIDIYEKDDGNKVRRNKDNLQIKKELDSNIKFVSKMKGVEQVLYCYERHQTGIPHSHCMVFCELSKIDKIQKKLKAKYEKTPETENSVGECADVAYVAKETTSIGDDGQKCKRFDTAKVAGIQKKKQIHYTHNLSTKAKKIKEIIDREISYIKQHYANLANARRRAKRRDKTNLVEPQNNQTITLIKTTIKPHRETNAHLKHKKPKNKLKRYICKIQKKG